MCKITPEFLNLCGIVAARHLHSAVLRKVGNTVEPGYCDYHLLTKIGYYDYLSTLIRVFDRTVYITL